MNNKIRIELLPNYFLNNDGTFNKEEAIKLSGKIAGVCYDKEGFSHLENEPEEKTIKRVNMTLDNGHHSVYDHIYISFNIKNIPKMLAMVINNEHEYTTSEKSGRYTPVVKTEDSIITLEEERLYNKWLAIFKEEIKKQYGDVYKDFKIRTLAQENARYLVSVFMPTEMIYTTSLRQINYLASFMNDYISKANMNDYFEKNLALSMKDFINKLDGLNVLEERLMTNDKYRKLSLFGYDLANKEEYFGNVYCTNYKASFAELAQAQRHRTLDYQMEFLKDNEYYIPPIILNNSNLTDEWLKDIKSVNDIIPQGMLVLINEEGKYEDFILKCKERLCTAAQLEIMRQTRDTLLKYQKALEESNNPLKDEIKCYTYGARCTFKDFDCKSVCNFAEGKKLVRKI